MASTHTLASTICSPAPGSIWVVVPAFNEEPVIRAVLTALLDKAYRVVVVDDGSADRTAAESHATGAIVLRHSANIGQGAALQTGIAFALQNGAAYICTYDADGQHHPEDVDAMVRQLIAANAEVALGSRFLGSAPHMRFGRRLLLRCALFFTCIHSGLKLTDTHNGLRLFTRRAAQGLEIMQPRMAHASEILDYIARSKLAYVEVPTTISYTEYSRKKGQSAIGSLRILFDLTIGRVFK